MPSAGTATAAGPRLREAVQQAPAGSLQRAFERLFTLAFSGLVYPQIWEDPEVDLRALQLTPDSRVLTIASGGCNVLAYLTADPASIVAVDLNPAHVALTRLKLAAARALPDHAAFLRFFGSGGSAANLPAYHWQIEPTLDAETRAYWSGRDRLGRPRISVFARDFYRTGLLGRCIALVHGIARVYGVDPRGLVETRTPAEQRRFFDTQIAPLFEKRFVRWVLAQPASLFGLGIPPAQFALLMGGRPHMADVVRERLQRLACAFPLSENYFAWQAFGRRYAEGGAPLPPYLQERHFAAIGERAGRANVVNRSVTEHLADEPAQSFDAYVLLDAQDWMTDAQLGAIWSAITRTARPGARVIFRTAAEPTLLPGRVDASILDRWTYAAKESAALHAADRSSIYGGFHLYHFRG